MNSNQKKSEQLGMPHGTAANKLRKAILFSLLEETGKNICFQCGEKIGHMTEMSIEHKEPWLDSGDPVRLFFDLRNIAFSHLTCNIGAGRKTVKAKHGTVYSYRYKGCRCEECRCAKSKTNQKRKERGWR